MLDLLSSLVSSSIAARNHKAQVHRDAPFQSTTSKSAEFVLGSFRRNIDYRHCAVCISCLSAYPLTLPLRAQILSWSVSLSLAPSWLSREGTPYICHLGENGGLVDVTSTVADAAHSGDHAYSDDSGHMILE